MKKPIATGKPLTTSRPVSPTGKSGPGGTAATPSQPLRASVSGAGSDPMRPAVRRPAPPLIPQRVRQKDAPLAPSSGLGLTSDRALQRMLERLRAAGKTDERVLAGMAAVPRHLFVDEAFASRAYEDAALPIGHRQTISSPVTVARMLSLLVAGKQATSRVLEVGAGCGYQASVLARLFQQVHAIERLEALFEKAKANLERAGVTTVQLVYGDGFAGLPDQAPFDAIIVAAASPQVPQALTDQLAMGGRLVLPLKEGNRQVLAVIEKTPTRLVTERLDIVNFVPLVQGTVAR